MKSFIDLPATGIGLLGPGGDPALDSTGARGGEKLIEHQAVPVAKRVSKYLKSASEYTENELTPPWYRGYHCPTETWGA